MNPSRATIKKMYEKRKMGLYQTHETRDEASYCLKRMEKTDVALTLRVKDGEFVNLNIHELMGQVTLWNGLGVYLMDCNIVESELEGKNVWVWTISTEGDEAPMNPLAMAFGILVNGYTYISKDKNIPLLVKRLLKNKKNE